MDLLLAGNVVAYCLQLTVVIVACAGLPRLLRVHAPALQYLFWRVLLAVALLLPLLQPWMHVDAVLVLTSTSTAGAAAAPPRPPGPHIVLNQLVLLTASGIVVAGIFVRLACLGVGLWRLDRLRNRIAGRDCSDRFSDLQQWIGTSAAIRWSTDISQPVTFGWRRPVVLLPPSVARLDPQAARALVAHELFHVRRRDWLWQIAEEIVRAMFWFHPAMWWLVSRVQLARETVVDELSILATNSRRAYMDTLLAFADDSSPLPASGFSRRRHLCHRILLLSREASMSATRVTFASLVLAIALAASAAGAASAFPLMQAPRDPVPGQLSPEQRATLDRALDQARAALAREPNAPDLLNNLAAAIWSRTRDSELSSAEKERLLREGLSAETHALTIRPDYVPALVYKNLLLRVLAGQTVNPADRAAMLQEADTLRDRAMGLQGTTAAAAPPPPPPPPPPPSTEFDTLVASAKPLRVGSGIHMPTKIRDVRPVYPAEARAAQIQGVVIVEALIDKTGHVAEARILRSIPMLDQAALDAVRQWEYQPVLLNGGPVPVVVTLTVNFRLQ